MREEQRFLDKRMRHLSEAHLREKMAEQIESANEVYERCLPLFEQTLARL